MMISKNCIAGFLMGVSVGVAVGYFLKPPNESAAFEDDHEKKTDQAPKSISEGARVSWGSGPTSRVFARVS